MDPQLLDYYNRELTYMREAGSEFAQLHPKIARRLGMQGVEVADPYVERLIESFCFMSARMRIKLDAEFPRFSQRLLEVVYLPLMDMNTRQGAQALRDMLRLFVGADDAIAGRQVDGLIGSRIAPVTRRLPGNGPLVYGRGVQCDLTVDEDAFSGTSPYLFGLVLEHYLARHVSINVFTETRLESMQRGMVASWAARMGTRSMV